MAVGLRRSLQLRVLGPVDARADGRSLALGGAKQRAVLAMLGLEANRTVSADHLIEGLWGEQPPASAAKMLQNYVWRLRGVLGEDSGAEILTRGRDYELRIDPESVDVCRLERLLREATRAAAAGEPVDAARATLALWRGPALSDVADQPFAAPAIRRLEELRLEAAELAIDADLAAGRHHEVAAEINALVAEDPLRERFHAQRMLALYRCDRQAEALAAYRDARRTLVDEIGVEPGPQLHDLHDAMLRQDRSLDVEAAQASPLGTVPAHLQMPFESPRSTRSRRRSGPLPESSTRLVGRHTERRVVAERLLQQDVRLLTLVGPAGVGKTRLALEVAATIEGAFADGACWIELASVVAPEHVPATLARVLGAKPRSGEAAAEAIVRRLEPKHAFLVIDNFEHVLAAAPLVAELLSRCPRVSVLSTSREALDLAAEQVFEVPPLEVLDRPADAGDDDLVQADATALFLDAARRRGDDFRLAPGDAVAIAEICLRLDGLPLAIELAAARTRVLAPQQLAARLDQALSVLGSGPREAPDRQRTLRAAIEWSYRLLDPDERLVFARFAAFRGGATLDAAEAVTQTSLDILESLLAKHLLRRRLDAFGRPRFEMLATIRAYASERFAECPRADQTRVLHCRHYLALAEEQGAQLRRTGSYQLATELDSDIDNLRAALRWAIERPTPELAVRLAVALTHYWNLRDEHEGARWLETALALGDDGLPLELRARALVTRAQFLPRPSKLSEAEASAREALALCETSGNTAGRAESLSAIAGLMMARHRRDEAFRTACAALLAARRSGDPICVAEALTMKASNAPTLDAVLVAGREAIECYRALGNVKAATLVHNNLAYNAFVFGDWEECQRHVDAGLRIVLATGDELELAWLRGSEGLVALFTGAHDRAELAFRREVEYARDHSYDEMLLEGLSGLAAVFTTRDCDAVSARLIGAIEALELVSPDDATAQRLQARFFAPARERIGAKTWDRARAAGARLGRTAAIALALETARELGERDVELTLR